MRRVRSYEQMVKDGDWPPTARETVLFWIGLTIGLLAGFLLRGPQ